jgi:SAM-dependent methyltransferase
MQIRDEPRVTTYGASFIADAERISGVTDQPGLPARYSEPWRGEFYARLDHVLAPGIQVLDVGAGASPALPVDSRPPDCFYVGLDVSASELERAMPGSYDETIVADVTTRIPDLEHRFDAVVSLDVLEHLSDVELALENLRAYVRPGGALVARLSARYSAFAVVNRLVPLRFGVWAMKHLLSRETDAFPARYDRCYYSALKEILRPWRAVEIVPLYRAAEYFSFSRVLQRLYVGYENWTLNQGHRNLATHYLVFARR